MSKLGEHYKVAEGVLGGRLFYYENEYICHSVVKELLFDPCFAVEGGITLYQDVNNWLDLRWVKVETRVVGEVPDTGVPIKVVRGCLSLVVAYNEPERIDLDTTRACCREFMEAVREFGFVFKPIKGYVRDYPRELLLSTSDLISARRRAIEYIVSKEREYGEVVKELESKEMEFTEYARYVLSTYIRKYSFSFRKRVRNIIEKYSRGELSTLEVAREIIRLGNWYELEASTRPRGRKPLVPRYFMELYKTLQSKYTELINVEERYNKLKREIWRVDYLKDLIIRSGLATEDELKT